MARPLRLEVPGGTYHVTSRGNAGRRIYLVDGDRVLFLGLVGELVARFKWSCLAFCLMDTHYHLVVKTPGGDLSRGMRQLNGMYAQRFHKRHGTYGHVFQGRYHASLVQDDPYLLTVLRYVARNPVEAGLCARPADWRWSSHRAMLGMAPPGVVAVGEVLALIQGHGGDREWYRRLVEDESADPPQELMNGPVLGDDEFASGHLAPLDPQSEIPLHQYRQGRPPLDEILASSCSVEAIAAAYFEHRYRMREIAEALGCHYTTISRRLRGWHGSQVLDRKT